MGRAASFGVMAVAALGGCSPSLERLDEAKLIDTPQIQVKLVRYFQNLPLHFNGEIYVVVCSSAGSASWPKGKMNDAGWRPIGSGAAIGSKSAAQVAERVRPQFIHDGAGVLHWAQTSLSLSRDGCRTVIQWSPASLPAPWIEPLEKPDYCAPKGRVDCRLQDFEGARRPVYSNVRIGTGRQVSFDVFSTALKDGRRVHVSTDDDGRNWRVEAAPDGNR